MQLHVAAANGYVEVALYLLSKNCKVDIQDIDGWTPLHAAAFWEEVDLIELLGAHGADFKLRTFSGELPSGLYNVHMNIEHCHELHHCETEHDHLP